jgi:hypothetical protein
MKRAKELDMAERNVLVESDYEDYQRGGKKAKSEILDRLEKKTQADAGSPCDEAAWVEDRVCDGV